MVSKSLCKFRLHKWTPIYLVNNEGEIITYWGRKCSQCNKIEQYVVSPSGIDFYDEWVEPIDLFYTGIYYVLIKLH